MHLWRHAPRERVSWNVILSLLTKNFWKVTLHVSVWVEMMIRPTKRTAIMSRSTWACELKSVKTIYVRYNTKVTLHVSVWVEICWICIGINDYTSRSTWACELNKDKQAKQQRVFPSRSTWACELKYSRKPPFPERLSHAPRERVSWNISSMVLIQLLMVTLHVSVWVEMTDEEPTEEEPTGHAPRERVSWNENVCTDFQICCGHAPRERELK